MAERKVISKYYPPDFEPSKLKRQRKTQSTTSKLESVLMLSPFSMRRNRCGEFIYKGRKFNTRKQVTGERYLNIPNFRLFIRCTACSSEIALDTDFNNEDYKDTSGTTRNFKPWREARLTRVTEEERPDRSEREGEQHTLICLEARATNARTEMAIADALDEVRMQNARREIRIRSTNKLEGQQTGQDTQAALPDEDGETTKRALGKCEGEVVWRLPDDEIGAGTLANGCDSLVPTF
ncbi:hypothetical protein QM012_007928 [Aureobasidium pullulans]|uniref:Splicing factor YJU2 n=1 Tax=Aureobasidium pullulans TaxID=5580 RepID=A0ABR0TL25_AURPU